MLLLGDKIRTLAMILHDLMPMQSSDNKNSSVYRPVCGVGARQIDVTLSPLSVYTKHTLISHLLRRCYCWD